MRPTRPICFSCALAVAALLAACGSSSPVSAPGSSSGGTTPILGRCGAVVPPAASLLIANSGRQLSPLGRLTTVGNFPTGGRLSPDGRFYWSVSAGQGENDVHIVSVATGAVAQVLPLPGSYGQMVFSADGAHAYVSGTPKGSRNFSQGATTGDAGDVIHVFDIDASGQATEKAVLSLPATQDGSGRLNGVPPNPNLPNGPAGLAVTPDGKTLVVALYNADKAAIIDVATGSARTVNVGAYPFAVGFERSGRYAYVTNAFDGTASKIDVAAGSVAATISGLGGPDGDHNAQPQYVLGDPRQNLVYIAVTNHDGVAIVDTAKDTVLKFVSLKRAEGYGSQPVALALAPDGQTLYTANAGENAVSAIALADRPGTGTKAYDVIGKIPTADYATDVQLTPDGCTLVWQAGRGAGAGPNPQFCNTGHGCPALNTDDAPTTIPYPSYVADLLIGRVGILPTPDDATFAAQKAVVEAAQAPLDLKSAPPDTPLAASSGGPSDKIKYVFYVVKENRSYDQIFGSDKRGNGDPALEVLEDNCGASNTGFQGGNRNFAGCGTTPNAHALSRAFVLLDNFYEDSEVSTDGHVITTSAYATNYTLKSMNQDYSGRSRPATEVGVFPVTLPPRYSLFDQAVSQGISFRDYGELSGGVAPPFGNDGSNRPNYAQVVANADISAYPSNLLNGCASNQNAPNSSACAFDCGMGCKGSATLALSRIDAFNAEFTRQVATCVSGQTCGVPHFNYLIMMSDHTNGVATGARDPLSMVADNDLGVGQLVQILSASSIWPQSVVFVVEDDSQDGADHVDAHRAPALVIGPYVKRGGQVIHTHYDQESVIRSIELILGMQPLSLFDAVATPMYDAFTATPDTTPYTAIQPEKNLLAVCPCPNSAANAQLSAALPFNLVDAVPQKLADRILWQRVHGADSAPPAPGPNGSRTDAAQSDAVMRLYRRYAQNPARAKTAVTEYLGATANHDD